MNQMMFRTSLYAIVLLLSACEEKGPLERTGEKMDETVRTIKNGGEETTGDKIKDAAGDLKERADNATK